jgi:hypothetical protein
MKIRVRYTVEVDDGYRAAVRHYYGQTGLATRQELQQWFQEYGDTQDDDLSYDHEACCWGQAPIPSVRRRREPA